MLDSDSKKWLAGLFGDSVKFDEPMSWHTSLRVGGPAEAYVAIKRCEDLVKLVNWSRKKGFPCLVVGDGTNFLVKDGGINGIVVTLTRAFKKIIQTDTEKDGVIVTAMAGVRMQTLCRFAVERGLGGMNFALGIPGTVGGGIMMNAGTVYGSMESVIDSINVLLPTGLIKKIKKKDLIFNYRKLSWNKEKNLAVGLEGKPIILEGCFCLHPSDPQRLKKEAKAILKLRKKTQPAGSPTAGCFFKNPATGKTAGELIELAGLKGEQKGGAKISCKHANFIINSGRASAADILALMKLVQERVSKIFSIDLETEVKIVGT